MSAPVEAKGQRALLPEAMATLGKSELLISEFFHSIQGESSHAGVPCFFIRLTGCHLRCSWCDTVYSFHGGSRHTVDDCVNAAKESGAHLVEVTGGEPLLQDAVYKLLRRLCNAGHEVLLETSGALPIDRVDSRVRRIVDWKCPGSGMESRNEPTVLQALRSGDELKLVLCDRKDYTWARGWLQEHRKEIPDEVPVYFAPAFDRLPFQDLARWILEDRLSVRLGLQLHKWIWPSDTRGV
jgi:7-carboxy-7-deazaguanine synthase